jgi:hypothetical protein
VGHGERTRRLKRTVNDRISEVLEEAGLAEGDFLCECAMERCERTVHLSLAEYVSLDGNRTRLIAHARVDRKHSSPVVS